MPTLYLVATPIGNLEDMSFRAVRVLKEASLIAAEDTRKTLRLLARYDIHTPLTSYYEHSKLAKLDRILAALEMGDVALVSEAGMPGISDPGYQLVRAALEAGVTVTPVPGASAPVLALAASGLPTDRFLYLGFLPRRGVERRRLLGQFAGFPHTLVAFEAPHRLVDTLADLVAVLGPGRRLAAARELTKLHEEIVRGAAAEVLAHFRETSPRGEFTLVIAGADQCADALAGGAYVTFETTSTGVPDPSARIGEVLAGGASRSDAVRQLVEETGLPRREVYRLALGLEGEAAAAAPAFSGGVS
jgi:16S rRNA (cytidine1402-2'-O)-methyltransferase